MNLGLTIKRIRQDKNISQGELATACEISQTSLSQIETGAKRPSTKNLKKICKALEISESILYLYGMEEADVPKQKRELFRLLHPSIESLIEKLVH